VAKASLQSDRIGKAAHHTQTIVGKPNRKNMLNVSLTTARHPEAADDSPDNVGGPGRRLPTCQRRPTKL